MARPVPITLRFITAQLNQCHFLFGGLNTFGDNGETKTIGHGADRFQDSRIFDVPVCPRDKTAIDFEPRERIFLKQAQRREAGSKIVECDTYAQRPQFAQNFGRLVAVTKDRIFGDLDFELARAQAVPRDRGRDDIEQAARSKLSGEQIDPHSERSQPGTFPVRGRRVGLFDNPVADLFCDRALLKHREKRLRSQQPVIGMPPA